MIVLLAVVGILMSACQLKCLPGFRKLNDEILKRRESGKNSHFFLLVTSRTLRVCTMSIHDHMFIHLHMYAHFLSLRSAA